MQFLKPFPTLAVGVVLGMFAVPRVLRMVRK